MDFNFKSFSKRLEKLLESGEEPQKIIIGYKTYANLMKDDGFVKHISIDVNDPMIRYFKRIKIQIVPEKRYLEIN